MPRGGKRQGKPGASYSNRSDLNQPVRTAPSRHYGAAKEQAQAQKALPLPQAPGPPAAAPAAAPGPPAPAPSSGALPPDPGLLSGPTSRPHEPITSGLPVGAGPGPSALGAGNTPDDQLLANLYRAFQLAPSEGLRALIDQTERLHARPR